MSKKQLIDYTRWLWDMDRLKIDIHVKFETHENVVDNYLLKSTFPKKKFLEDLCEGCQFEHDLLICINCDDSMCQIKIKEKENEKRNT